jgi:hypothetical protein
MTEYNPEFYKKRKNLSDQLLDAAKDALDDAGNYEGLKKELEAAVEEGRKEAEDELAKKSLLINDNKGFII